MKNGVVEYLISTGIRPELIVESYLEAYMYYGSDEFFSVAHSVVMSQIEKENSTDTE